MPALVAAQKSASILFAASYLAVAGLMLSSGVGCESESAKADKTVAENIRKAENERGQAAITGGFQQAATLQGASPATTSQAKVLLAQAEVEQARAVQIQVAHNEQGIERLIGDISDIAGQVHANNIAIAGYLEVAPKGTGDLAKTLEGTRAQVQGKGPEAVWKVGPDGSVPALSNATARAAALAPKVAELKSQREALVKQRTAAEAKSAELLAQSKKTKGKASVDTFIASDAASKESAGLANQISQVDYKLAQVEQEAALAGAQATELEAATKEISAGIEANKKSEKEIEALITAHRALSETLVHGDGSTPTARSTGDTATPTASKAAEATAAAQPAAFQEKAATEAPADGAAPVEAVPTDAAPAEGTAVAPANLPPSTVLTNVSMASKAKELSELLIDTAAKRKTVVELLTSALGHYDGAIADANKLRSELDTKTRELGVPAAPQAKAWSELKAVFDPAKLNLQKASAQQVLADINRDATASLVSRKQLLTEIKPVLEEANIALPANLDEPDINAQLEAAQVASAEGYDATLKLLQEEVIDRAGGGPAGNAGQVMHALAMHGRAQLALVVNDTATADRIIGELKNTVNATPDAYPAVVLQTLGLKAATPQTGPTTGPAAAPAKAVAPGTSGGLFERAQDPAAAPMTAASEGAVPTTGAAASVEVPPSTEPAAGETPASEPAAAPAAAQ